MVPEDIVDTDKVTLETASNIKTYSNLGRESYQRNIRALQSSGYDILPSWKQLRKFETSITQSISELPNQLGVEFSYVEAVQLSLERIFMPLQNQPPPDETYTIEIKDGCDGSGMHSIFNQKGNKLTHNIVMYMFTPLKLISNATQTILWQEQSPASPHSCKPKALILGKETDDSCKEMYKLIQQQRSDFSTNSLELTHLGQQYNISVHMTLSMIDGRMRSLLSGLGGSFCILCTCSRSEAVSPTSFDINRTAEQIHEIWNKINTGELLRNSRDSAARQGGIPGAYF